MAVINRSTSPGVRTVGCLISIRSPHQTAAALSSAVETTGGDPSQVLQLRNAADQLLAADVPPDRIAERIRELALEGYQPPD